MLGQTVIPCTTISKALTGYMPFKILFKLLKAWVDEQLEDGLPKLSMNGVSIGHTIKRYHLTAEQLRFIKKLMTHQENRHVINML